MLVDLLSNDAARPLTGPAFGPSSRSSRQFKVGKRSQIRITLNERLSPKNVAISGDSI